MTKYLANRNYNFLNANRSTNTLSKHLEFEFETSPDKRDLIFQRASNTLDPVFRYYRYGVDEDSTKLIIEMIAEPNAPQSEGEPFVPGQHLGGDLEALTAEPPGSVNIFWGYGEWEGIENQPYIWNEQLPGLNTTQQQVWTKSLNREGRLWPPIATDAGSPDNDVLDFKATYPAPFGSGEDFYMADALSGLVEESAITNETMGRHVPDSRLEAVLYAAIEPGWSLENLPDQADPEITGLINSFLQKCKELVGLRRVLEVTNQRMQVRENMIPRLRELRHIEASLKFYGASDGEIKNTRKFYFRLEKFRAPDMGGRRPQGTPVPLYEAEPEDIRITTDFTTVNPHSGLPPQAWSVGHIPQTTNVLGDPEETPFQADGRDIIRKHTLGYFYRTEYNIIKTGHGDYFDSRFHDSTPWTRFDALNNRFDPDTLDYRWAMRQGLQPLVVRTNRFEVSPQIVHGLTALGFGESEFVRLAANHDSSWAAGEEDIVDIDKNALDVLNLIFGEDGFNQAEDPQRNFTRAAFKAAFATSATGARIAASLESYKEYEFYDFKSETSFVRDSISNAVATSAGAQGAGFDSSILAGAFIRPEYNYYSKRYENAIADASVSEIILPNMYIYSLVAASPDLGLESPRWDESLHARQTQDDYDRLITFGEFNAKILPNLESGNQDYLNRYSEALEGKNFSLTLTTPEYLRVGESRGQTVDDGESRGSFGSRVLDLLPEGERTLLQKYYNLDSHSNQIDLYDKINIQKINFPMFIEVGVPTIKMGETVSLMQDLIPTDQITHSILTTTPEEEPAVFNCTTTAIFKDSLEETPLVQPLYSPGQVLNVYDLEEWISNCTERALQGDPGSHGSLTLFRGDAPPGDLQHGNDVLLLALRNNIVQQAHEKILPYQKLLLGLNRNAEDYSTDPVRLCDSETIMYKLAKIDAEGTVIQNFFFPNTSQNFINYVDTQVKYGKEYEYELHAYDVIYGTKYRFRHRESALDLVGPDNDDKYQGAYASFNVESLPCVKIAEYKVNSKSWLSEAINLPEDTTEVGGVFYPTAKVADFPPIPPEVNIFPYRGLNNKVGIFFNPTVEDRTGKNAIRYYALTQEEERLRFQDNKFQRDTRNFDLKARHLEFRGEGDDVKMEIYRLENLPVANSLEEFYRAFGDVGPHKVLSILPDAPEEESVLSFDISDDVEPNKNYFYFFRSIDRHNNFSNPSLIYQVTLESSDEFTYPNISVYNPVFEKPTKESKKMIRYVEISASDLQSLPFEDIFTQGSVPEEPVRSLVRGIEQESFLIRFISRDTGRKMDVKVSFNVSEKTISLSEEDNNFD